MICAKKPFLKKEQLRGQRKAILEDAHLKPREINLDSCLQLRKWPAEEVVVHQEGHLSGSHVQFDEVGFMRIAVEDRSTFNEHP